MSLKNLLVNARTKILEFKRKHNLLVEKIPSEIENAIQADKNIISQIKVEYDVDNDVTRVIFPKGILPIIFTYEIQADFIYCNYTELEITNMDGEVVGGITVDEDHFVVTIDGEFAVFPDKDYVLYLPISGDLDDGSTFPNWYDVLHPQSGTKLYHHELEITLESNLINLEFVSNVAKYTTTNLEEKFSSMFGGRFYDSQGSRGYMYWGYCDLGEINILYIDNNGLHSLTEDLSSLESVNDTVTEL